MNLFASMILQCLVRLVIYVDQMIVRHQLKNSENDELNQNQTNTHSSNQVWGIDNTVRYFRLKVYSKHSCKETRYGVSKCNDR